MLPLLWETKPTLQPDWLFTLASLVASHGTLGRRLSPGFLTSEMGVRAEPLLGADMRIPGDQQVHPAYMGTPRASREHDLLCWGTLRHASPRVGWVVSKALSLLSRVSWRDAPREEILAQTTPSPRRPTNAPWHEPRRSPPRTPGSRVDGSGNC